MSWLNLIIQHLNNNLNIDVTLACLAVELKQPLLDNVELNCRICSPSPGSSVVTHKLCWKYFIISILHNFKPRDFSVLTKIPANLYWLEIPQGVSWVSGWKFLQLVRRLQVGFRSRQIPPQLRRWLAWPGRFTDNAGCSRWETFVWPFNRPLTFPRNCQAAE